MMPASPCHAAGSSLSQQVSDTDLLPQRWATRLEKGQDRGAGAGEGQQGEQEGGGLRGRCIWTHAMLGVHVRMGLLT